MDNMDYKEYLSSLGFTPPKDPFVVTRDMAEKYREIISFNDGHVNFINELNGLFDFTGKTVLEIGGSNMPKELITDQLKVKNWVSVDTPWWNAKKGNKHYDEMKFFDIKSVALQEEMNRETYFICRGLTDDITAQFYEQFDMVVSFSCFEHIQNLSLALENVYRCLKEDGILYAHFAQTWSSGSHFWIPELDLYFNKPSFIPKYAHLLYTQREIYQILLKECGPRHDLEKWSKQIKYGYEVNHYFFEDFDFFLRRSNFTEIKAFFIEDVQIDDALQDRLEKLCSGYKRFSGNHLVGAGRIVAKKKFCMAELVDKHLNIRGITERCAVIEQPLKCYLIATTERSGSTLLSESLWISNLAGHPDEFLTGNGNSGLIYRVIDCDDFSIERLIGLLMQNTCTPNGVFGMKEFYRFYAKWGFPLDSYNPSIIYLTRRNKIRQGVSYYKAALSGSWDSNYKKGKELSKEDYSFDGIRKLININASDDLQWQQYFIEHNITPVRVIYEDFVKDIPGTVSRVMKEALDIDLPPEQVRKPSLKKQSDILSDYYYYRFLSDLAAQGMTAEDFYSSLGIDYYSD